MRWSFYVAVLGEAHGRRAKHGLLGQSSLNVQPSGYGRIIRLP